MKLDSDNGANITHTTPSVSDNTEDNDDEASSTSTSSYIDPSTNDLGIISGAALLTADCMGTGILALPHDMKVLGSIFGLTFLVLNLPINLYAGTILGGAAGVVEKRLAGVYQSLDEGVGGGSDDDDDDDDTLRDISSRENATNDGMERDYESEHADGGMIEIGKKKRINYRTLEHTNNRNIENAQDQEHHPHHDINAANTFDFIGMTSALFDVPNANSNARSGSTNATTTTSGDGPSTTTSIGHPHPHLHVRTKVSSPTKIVTAVYYTNIFLVLGNYILVMSHAVAAMIGEESICLPNAGIIASTLMFGISQLRTMANLGRSASAISLGCLAIVVVQCLVSIDRGDDRFTLAEADVDRVDGGEEYAVTSNTSMVSMWQSVMRQFAAISSIGFAVGSQKLFLNIRHEFKRREEAPKSLAISLTTFGSVYVLVCILAGSDPPSLLFDAIGPGSNRRIAGFLLWVHVAVSYAINSQALCSSIDRLCFHRFSLFGLNTKHRIRWALLTLLVSISSYFVANAVPFFKDLVALIGAMTSVPLTLLLPAIFHRKIMRVPLFKLGSMHDIFSFLLVVFSVLFLFFGVIGSLSSIQMDWAHHGPPFACH